MSTTTSTPNTRRPSLRTAGIGVALAAMTAVLLACAATPASSATSKTVAVKITAGHETDPVDHGRPVVLIAAALGVPTEVFREAFSGVTPADPNDGPTSEEAQKNKAALLKVLAPYGVTNERLDEVSNFYRYVESNGELWTHAAAKAKAVVRNGKVVSLKLVVAGAGYSSTPKVTVTGYPAAKVKVKVTYGTDLQTNGRIGTLKLK